MVCTVMRLSQVFASSVSSRSRTRSESYFRSGAVEHLTSRGGVIEATVMGSHAYLFDDVVLDEAQAIKNPSSVSAKAARALCANHRFALSGTPIENHLGELWSLFEFLNPGLLSSGAAFSRWASRQSLDDETVVTLARGLRPF
jgi:hypothetical protein